MIERFVAQRKDEWQRLERLAKLAAGKGVAALSAEEITDLGRLYRRAAADLAIARRDFPGDRVALYLNQLVARAHAAVYRSEPGDWRQGGIFFARGLPNLFRETLPFTAAAFLVFAVAGTIGFFAVLFNPDGASYIVPSSLIATVKQQRMWTEDLRLPSEILASMIMTNNIRVAFFAFAGGVLAGLGSFYVLAFNGLSFGAVAGLCHYYGLSLRLWSFVAPHGGIELTVIFISGGAGLKLGYALLHPGLLPRRHALLLAARQAVRLLFGCIPLLVFAGIIEGFISPSPLPHSVKLAFGALAAASLFCYLFLAGRAGGARVSGLGYLGTPSDKAS